MLVVIDWAQSLQGLSIDMAKLAKALGLAAQGAILLRVARGRDMYDRAFVGYSRRYRRALLVTGRNVAPPTLRLSGGLLRSLHVAQTSVGPTEVRTTLALDSATSRRVRLTRGRSRAQGAAREAPHNVVGAALHYGTKYLPARPWLGLSRTDQRIVEETLQELLGSLVKVKTTP